MAFTFPRWGAWQVRQAFWSACWTSIPLWQAAHESAAADGACGAWHVVQTACAWTVAALSVGFSPWHVTHTVASAAKSWGL
jgi:hypothetical protein